MSWMCSLFFRNGVVPWCVSMCKYMSWILSLFFRNGVSPMMCKYKYMSWMCSLFLRNDVVPRCSILSPTVRFTGPLLNSHLVIVQLMLTWPVMRRASHVNGWWQMASSSQSGILNMVKNGGNTKKNDRINWFFFCFYIPIKILFSHSVQCFFYCETYISIYPYRARAMVRTANYGSYSMFEYM